MTTPTCPITGRPLPDGYHAHPTLLPRVQAIASDLTLIIPDSIDVALGLRQRGHTTTRQPHTNTGILLNVSIYDDIQEMLTSITYWTQTAAHHLNTPPKQPTLTGYAQLIHTHADQLLRWQDAPTFIDELEYTIKRCERLANPPHARTLVTCPNCATRIYTRPTHTQTTCAECETTIHIQTRKAQMWEAAIYTWMPRKYAAAIVYLTTGKRITRSQLQHWIRQGHIKPLGKRNLIQPNEIITIMRKKRAYKTRRQKKS